MKKIIVTGANRGLGLEFVKQYLEKDEDNHLIATFRDQHSTQALSKLQAQFPSRLTLSKLDITNDDDIKQFAADIDQVDLLILNAGTTGFNDNKPLGYKAFSSITGENLEQSLKVNVTGQHKLLLALGTKLTDQPNNCVVYISTPLAIADTNKGSGTSSYAISKAAGNALIWEWCKDTMSNWMKKYTGNTDEFAYTPGGFAISPGWVRTDMGGPKGQLSTDESISAMIKTIESVQASKEFNAFYTHDGKKLKTYDEPTSMFNLHSSIQAKINAVQSLEERSPSVLINNSLLGAGSSTSTVIGSNRFTFKG